MRDAEGYHRPLTVQHLYALNISWVVSYTYSLDIGGRLLSSGG